MIVETKDGISLEIGNDPYKMKVLEAFGLVGCNPTTCPVTKQIMRDIKSDVDEGKFMDKDATKEYQCCVGMLSWLPQTIGVDMALSYSLSAKYNAAPVDACMDLVKHQVRYLAGTSGQRLRNKPDSLNGLVVASDSDYSTSLRRGYLGWL